MPTIVAKGLQISTNSTMAYGMTTRSKSSKTSLSLASSFSHDLCSPVSCSECVLYDWLPTWRNSLLTGQLYQTVHARCI